MISAGGAAQTLPRIDALAQAAACLGAEVLLFSEAAVHGYDYDLTPASVRALAGLTLPAGAAANWLHELQPKPGATVALTAGDRPALVLGTHGKGRIAMLALAPLGEDIPGAWWRSEAGQAITAAACRWLVEDR